MAVFDFGIPAEEVGSLNMKEYDALVQRKKANDNRERLNVGIIAAAVINCALGDADRKPVSAYDFVPGMQLQDEVGETDLTKMTPEQQKIYLMNTLYKRKYR